MFVREGWEANRKETYRKDHVRHLLFYSFLVLDGI